MLKLTVVGVAAVDDGGDLCADVSALGWDVVEVDVGGGVLGGSEGRNGRDESEL